MEYRVQGIGYMGKDLVSRVKGRGLKVSGVRDLGVRMVAEVPRLALELG